MQIGINLLYLISGQVGGTETYARELIPHLALANKLVIYCDLETAKTFAPLKNVKICALPFSAKNRIARLIIEQTLLPILCFRDKIDVLFSLGYSAPFVHHCPSVVTIHDLNWYYHPEDFTPFNRFVWEWLTKLSARFSTHIITDSQASFDSIHQILSIPRDKITSILHATPTKVKLKKFNIKKPYLFTVMANYPHKNIVTLLKSFDFIFAQFPNLNLVVCGLGNHKLSRHAIQYLGYVTREELAYLYSNAAIFVFPSAYEGFGYPVLEAMSYSVPVVSSNATSLKEVVGSGGILVEPFDIEGYSQAIKRILTSSKLRDELILRGTKRASELKWEHTSSETLKVMKKVRKIYE